MTDLLISSSVMTEILLSSSVTTEVLGSYLVLRID
jgi:hypothetical protein